MSQPWLQVQIPCFNGSWSGRIIVKLLALFIFWECYAAIHYQMMWGYNIIKFFMMDANGRFASCESGSNKLVVQNSLWMGHGTKLVLAFLAYCLSLYLFWYIKSKMPMLDALSSFTLLINISWLMIISNLY